MPRGSLLRASGRGDLARSRFASPLRRSNVLCLDGIERFARERALRFPRLTTFTAVLRVAAPANSERMSSRLIQFAFERSVRHVDASNYGFHGSWPRPHRGCVLTAHSRGPIRLRPGRRLPLGVVLPHGSALLLHADPSGCGGRLRPEGPGLGRRWRGRFRPERCRSMRRRYVRRGRELRDVPGRLRPVLDLRNPRVLGRRRLR